MQSQDPSQAVPTAPEGSSGGQRFLHAEVEGEALASPAREVPTPPTTGDAVVDAATVDLAAAEAGSLAERIDAGERVHQVLQERLSDLSTTRDPGCR
ncbi:MAG: hypothetical protein ABI336_12335 [Humibacillus sp.]